MTDSGYGCLLCGAPPWGPHSWYCLQVTAAVNGDEEAIRRIRLKQSILRRAIRRMRERLRI